jgi:hypothetical protein
MEYEFPNQLVAETDTRAGRMFNAGDVRVTISIPRNKRSENGETHVTVRFKALRDNRDGEGRNWLRVPLNEATHVFIEVPNASGDWPDKIGVFYPRTGKFFEDTNADPYRITTAILAARWLNEGTQRSDRIGSYKLQEESHCGVCGRTLTDPESIDRGIGPECYGKQTGSQHQVKKSNAPLRAYLAHHDGKITADDIIELILDLPDEEIDHIRDELNMWQDADRQSLFGDR